MCYSVQVRIIDIEQSTLLNAAFLLVNRYSLLVANLLVVTRYSLKTYSLFFKVYYVNLDNLLFATLPARYSLQSYSLYQTYSFQFFS